MSEKKKKSIGKNVGVAADKFSVVNFDGEITKPASVLIEKLSAGIGEFYAPLGKILHAKADAKVARIEAETYELQKRAAHRVMGEYMREQKNIDAVTVKTLNRLSPDTTEETVRSMDDDKVAFMRNFFKTVSNDEMQDIWAGILAGEARAPGSFSKSTVDTVGKMGKEDALMFSDFCQFVWSPISETEEEFFPLIYDSQNEVYQGQRRMFDVAKHLDYLRLISYSGVGGYSQIYYANPQSDQAAVIWVYQRDSVLLDIPQAPSGKEKNRHDMSIGHAMFTEAGRQLYRICKPPKNDAFFQYILEKWRKLGYNPKAF